MTYEGTQGSCKNLYGGKANPARIDFAALIKEPDCASNLCEGMQLLALTQISHTAADYMFYGLGRNGYHSITRFWEAVEFFWHARSNDPSTWHGVPDIIQVNVSDKGKKSVSRNKPSDETLKLQCFDVYYELSGLANQMNMNIFLDFLKSEREKIILKNLDQVTEYFKISLGGQMSFLLEHTDFIQTMILPTAPEQIEKLLLPYVNRANKKFVSRSINLGHARKHVTNSIGQQSFL